MGVLNNNRRVVFKSPLSGGETTETSSDDDGPLQNIPAPQPQVQQPQRRPRPPPSPASTRKVPLAGTSLKLKKGRRARHRYDSERSLFAFADIDPEDAPEGWDILEENTSHFRSLLDNQILLEQFLDNEDIHDASYDQVGKAANGKCEKNQNRDPESSFLRISSHLRQALKKHFPMGMLAGLEEQIIGHFVANPDECFVSTGLSSYERLLAHTCCMYNHLISESFDDNGVRKLKVVNPNGNHFEPVDPDLVKYLTIRNNFK